MSVPGNANRIGPRMRELLRRVLAAGAADRFTLRQVCPADAAEFLASLEWVLERGWAERVVEGCGRWHYRLTPLGVGVAGSPGAVAL